MPEMRLDLDIVCLLAFSSRVHAQKGAATNFTIRDLAGRHLHLSDFKKNVVLMSFWATWCKGCTGKPRHLEKLYQKYKAKGFVVLAISMDGPESQANVKPVVQCYNLTFPVAIDREPMVVKLYNPTQARCSLLGNAAAGQSSRGPPGRAGPELAVESEDVLEPDFDWGA